jgi:hypothetical protein
MHAAIIASEYSICAHIDICVSLPIYNYYTERFKICERVIERLTIVIIGVNDLSEPVDSRKDGGGSKDKNGGENASDPGKSCL